ncbi:MAG: prolyl oligopeptidase family serine peptidase [Pseudomonadota bacterium]
MRLILLALLLFAGMPAAAIAQSSGFDARLLARLARLSDPQVAPDGARLVYALRETDMAANRGRTDLWLLDVKNKNALPQRIAAHEADDDNPRWAADGGAIYFLSKRSGTRQVWRLALDGAAPVQVTSLPLEVGNLVVSPSGRHLAFTMRVFNDCPTLACTAERLAAAKAQAATGRVYDRLFIRHWDSWEDGRRTHLFVQPLDEQGLALGAPIDVSAGFDGDVAAVPFGDAADIAFTGDGAALIFAARKATPDEAWSTNYDLYRVAIGGGALENLTPDNPAYDGRPAISRNGRWLAYLAMARPGYEADRQRIVLMDLHSGERRVVTEDWDRSVDSLAFFGDGRMLIATANHLGQKPLWAIDGRSGQATRLSGEGTVAAFTVSRKDIFYVRRDLESPEDLYVTRADGRAPRRLTEVNAAALSNVAMGKAEQFSFPGWNGETVHGYVLRPANFSDGKRYPVAFIVHGGPQSSFANDWSYRWNPQVYAGAGYGVVFVDFHGSTGYGQAFTDSIAGDWGGKPLEDWQKGLAAALARYPWLDGERACALGASYGGYAMAWIAGQWPDRFKCLVNHAGVSELRSMYFTTEELWFVEHDFAGPYFENPQGYERFNPIAQVKNWKTPTLVIQGGKDYRVPEGQSLATFTALQRRGVPSRLVYFPDENHHILSPANSIQWHDEVLGWLQRWLAP